LYTFSSDAARQRHHIVGECRHGRCRVDGDHCFARTALHLRDLCEHWLERDKESLGSMTKIRIVYQGVIADILEP